MTGFNKKNGILIGLTLLLIGLVSWSANASMSPRHHASLISTAEETYLHKSETASPAAFEDVNKVARAVTVFVGENIETIEALEDAAAQGATFQTAGSGLIVARRGPTYYVVTNEHVARPRGIYGIRTSDGELHQVDNSLPPRFEDGQEDKNIESVTRFGEFVQENQAVDGYDLALLEFESDKDYPVAVVGNAEDMNLDESIFVSGWPLPSDISETRNRVLRSGQLVNVLAPADPKGNYSLCYTAETAPGMSGGPVFNENGEVIGIHGAGRDFDNSDCVDTSFGIKINDFIEEQEKIERYSLSDGFQFPPVSLSEFTEANIAENADRLTAEEYKSLFSDVSATDPAYEAIVFVSSFGCMGPYDNGRFAPEHTPTRGEFIRDMNSCLDMTMDLVTADSPEDMALKNFPTRENLDRLAGLLDRAEMQIESLLALASPQFSCQEAQQPRTLINERVFINWESREFGPSYSPEYRCNQVSSRLNSYSNSGLFNSLDQITYGIQNNYWVLCLSNPGNADIRNRCLSGGLIVTLGSRRSLNEQQAQQALQEFKASLSNPSDSAPLETIKQAP